MIRQITSILLGTFIAATVVVQSAHANDKQDATDVDLVQSHGYSRTALLAMIGWPGMQLNAAPNGPAGNVVQKDLETAEQNKAKPETDKRPAIPLVDIQPLAIEAVVNRLKHPGTAQFRLIRLYDQRSDRSDARPVVCGEVNAMNSLGDYAGFQRFISFGMPDDTQLDDHSEAFAAKWLANCDGATPIDTSLLHDERQRALIS